MREMRERIARILEECTTRRGFFHPNVASWEYEWLLAWRDRTPQALSETELSLLEGIESLVLGRVR